MTALVQQEFVEARKVADGSVIAWRRSMPELVWQLQIVNGTVRYRLINIPPGFVGTWRAIPPIRRQLPSTPDELVRFAHWFTHP